MGSIQPDDPMAANDIECNSSKLTNGDSNTSTINPNSRDEWIYPYPTDFKLTEKPIDEIRELKVAVLGAGISGITAGILLPAKVPGIKLTILDKNVDVGGTWLENIYPGVRCDIPAHAYQSTFSPNTQWSEEYAQGPEILAYWQSVARRHDVYPLCRFRTRVLGCYWQEVEGQWKLQLRDLGKGDEQAGVYEECFDYVITAIGHFNEWRLPTYPGMERFGGKIMHSSGWDPEFDATGKRVATIGNGASGIQVTTEIRKIAAHVDHYARSKTWIAGSFAPGSAERQDIPIPIPEERKQLFRDNPAEYLHYRKSIEGPLWRAFPAQIADSEASENIREKFVELMRRRLVDDPSLLEKLVPDFPPHCRRLTPGPGYLEALSKENLTFIQTPIHSFTATGITTTDGIHREVDAIICSTGANTDFAPPFPIVSGPYDLARDWKPSGAFGFPYTYAGTSTPGFPNLSFLLGPNATGPSGTVPHAIETALTYLASLLRKMSSQGIRTMSPKKEAADEWLEYCDAFFPRTNLAKNCSSWSNGGQPGGRIHGHWPGSASHLAVFRRQPRWEDYEYSYVRPENRFAYLGNGWTKAEQDGERDMTAYLRLEGENDLRDLHERWWELS